MHLEIDEKAVRQSVLLPALESVAISRCDQDLNNWKSGAVVQLAIFIGFVERGKVPTNL